MKTKYYLLVASLCFLATTANSASIKIDTVTVDQVAGELYITGVDLTQPSFTPAVTLDDQSLFVCPSCYSATNITAVLPPGLLSGDYALRVFTSNNNYFEYHLTIGAVGLQGEKGEKGDTGMIGPQGPGIGDFMCDKGEYVIGFKDNVPVCSQSTNPCKAAESDANSIAASIADYFAIPSHITLGTTPIVLNPVGGPPESGGAADMTFPALSEDNTARIKGDFSEIIIEVSDNSGRCPIEYQDAHPNWNGAGVYTKSMK
ncbi:MAG: hypothetical protein D3915_06385 [Candidatus Electrothrix sp. AU1_5]|nr:hypothetical protein [Candidatus Electrothrix gigas]